MKRLIIVTTLILTTLLLMGGCRPAAKAPEPVSIIIVDDMDREILLPKQPTRIVSLAPASTEILFALGLDDRIAGVTEWCFFPAEAVDKEKVGDISQPSVERIMSLQADLVVATSMHRAVVEQLDDLGVPVIVLNATTVPQVLLNIKLLGQATGTTEVAESVTREIEDILTLVKSKVSHLRDEDRPVVYFEIWHDPIWTAGPNTFIHELITLAGGVNVAADALGTYVEYSFEVLLARNPEVMFYGHAVETVEEVLARKNWGSISAIKHGRAYLVNEDIVLQPGPRIGLGLLELAKNIHPKLWD